MSSTNGPANRSKAKVRTVMWQEVPEWYVDNHYILSGYRLAKADYLEIFTSLTFLHNETCNVYTHLVGALLLPLIATIFLQHLGEPRFLNVPSIDYAMTRSFISLSYAQCIHTWLPCCKVSQPVIHWKSVSLKVPIKRIEALSPSLILRQL
ncbi:cytochrome P450 [Apiospora arundinis]